MTEWKVYRTYRPNNDGKAPIVAVMRALFESEGLLNKEGYKEVALLTGRVQPSTYKNLFDGDTKTPIERTVEATLSALGFHRPIVPIDKRRNWNKAEELRKAAKWALQHDASKARRKKRNGSKRR
jgi:hypothetical protein